MTICAVVAGGTADGLDLTLRALRRQTLAPERVITAPVEGVLASTDDWTWLWLLEASVAPEPAALRELIAACGPAGSRAGPALLASRVVTPAGALHPLSVPIVEVLDADALMTALDNRLLALRAARPGSVLVHRRALDVPGALDRSPLGFLGWTARVLKQEPGLLVPASVAVRRVEAGDSLRVQPAARLRLVTSEAFEPRERPWLAFHLAVEARRATQDRLRRARRRAGAAARRAGLAPRS